MGSASVPVTPHVKRSGITVNRRADHFPQVPLRPSESNSFLTDPNGGRFVAANHSNQKVISYPSYLAANTGSVYPHGWPCEVAMKPLWSGDHCTTYEVPVRSVEESTFREQQPSYTPFLNAPGSLPTLHNDGIFYPISRIKPTHVSHISHSPWTCVGKSTRYHPPAACHMCSQPQPCLHEVPYAAPTNLLKHSPYSAPKHQVPYAPHDQSDFSQYVYPSSSLAAILSPIVTHRWQHPQRQSLRHSDHGRGLRQQQSQPMNARSPDPIHIPLMERSTSHVQLSYPQNNYRLASPVETGLTNTHSTCRPSNLGYSLQYIPRSKNVYPGRCDLSPGFDYSNEAHPNPLLHCHCYPATTINEYFRRAASLGVSSWNVDPLWTTAPSNERLFRADELNDDEALYLHESDAPSSRRNILTNQLQAERAHFALLQTQFSRQLCDTWAYLKATRGQQVDKFADFGTHLVGNNMYNNPPLYGCELRHDPAGASDGASTGGGGGNICNMSASGAYDGHGQFHNTSPEHHLYEACSQLNEDASSERINSCKNQGAHDLQLPTNERVYENKLDRNTKGPGQEWSSSVLLRHPHADPNTQSSRQC
ncbi:unnamed protein product [Heterobilharzia americana]|nr:unnamed protein product [Heterobilharzia americana]